MKNKNFMLVLVDAWKTTENGDVVRKSCISGLNKVVSFKTLKTSQTENKTLRV